ncbi:MAG: asparagine synthase-related protein [Verrucomicrobiia bacterium]
MPGLVGIISTTPQNDIERVLSRMIGSVRHFDWYKVEQFVSPERTFACAHVHLGILQTQNSSHHWFHGEETDGFTRVEYDEKAQSLTISNDAFGMMPLFYFQNSTLLIFGTEMKAVLAHPAVKPNVDPRGLADLMAYGFIFGEKTLVQGLKCLPGGSTLRFDARTGQTKFERTWDFRQHIGRGTRGNGKLLDEIADKFKSSVNTRCAGGLPIGVSLSGGYDSRTITAIIDHQRTKIQTLTLDVSGGADQIIAEQIARCTSGLPNHHFIENSTDFFAKWPQYVREMVWLSDGMYYDEACVMMSTLDKYRDFGVQVTLRGHGGELARMQWAYELACNRFIQDCRTQSDVTAQLFRQMAFGLADADFDSLFVPELAKSLRGAARTSMEEAFAGVDAAWDVIDQVSCVFVQEYLRRQSVPSLAQLRSRIEVRMPFLDREYVDAVLQLAPTERLGTRVHRHLLARHNPALLRITNANTGAPAGAGDLTQRLYRKTNGYLKRFFGYERYKHYVDVAGWLRGPLRPHIESVLLDKRTLTRGLYRGDGVGELVNAHMSGRHDHGSALLLLLFLELWNRQFVDGESWRC